MNFNDFLSQSRLTESNSLQENSRRMYQSSLRTYERVMRMAFPNVQLYPITEPLMRVFIEYSRTVLNRTCKTLLNYIASFTHYFHDKNLPDLTKTESFRRYRLGLNKTMKTNGIPHRKQSLLPEHLENICNITDFNNVQQLTALFSLSLMFFGFFRASELTSLKWKHLKISEDTMIVHLDYSKTDVTGKGTDVTIGQTQHNYDCIKLAKIIKQKIIPEDDTPIWIWHQDTLRKILSKFLKTIGVEDYNSYSLHSCRRGGAHAAAMKGIQDCAIKAHGRWLSECYTMYTEMEARNAGLLITKSI